jgi:hypothetical protein
MSTKSATARERRLLLLGRIQKASAVLAEIMGDAFMSPGLAPLWQGCQALVAGVVDAPDAFAWVLRNLANLLMANLVSVSTPRIRLRLAVEACGLTQESLSFQDNAEVQQKLGQYEQFVQQLKLEQQQQPADAVLVDGVITKPLLEDPRVLAQELFKVGTRLHDAQRWREALEAFTRARRPDPEHDEIFFMWMYASSHCADWGDSVGFTKPLVERGMARLRASTSGSCGADGGGGGGGSDAPALPAAEVSSSAQAAEVSSSAQAADAAEPGPSPLAGLLALAGLRSLPEAGSSSGGSASHNNYNTAQTTGGDTVVDAEVVDTSRPAGSWDTDLRALQERLRAAYLRLANRYPPMLCGHPWILENFPVARDVQLLSARNFATIMSAVAQRDGVAAVTAAAPSLAGAPGSPELGAALRAWAAAHKDHPLRVGFVSGDFRQKATLYLCVEPMVKMFEQTASGGARAAPQAHPASGRAGTELFVFATTQDFLKGSPWRKRLQAGVPDGHFIELAQCDHVVRVSRRGRACMHARCVRPRVEQHVLERKS